MGHYILGRRSLSCHQPPRFGNSAFRQERRSPSANQLRICVPVWLSLLWLHRSAAPCPKGIGPLILTRLRQKMPLISSSMIVREFPT